MGRERSGTKTHVRAFFLWVCVCGVLFSFFWRRRVCVCEGKGGGRPFFCVAPVSVWVLHCRLSSRAGRERRGGVASGTRGERTFVRCVRGASCSFTLSGGRGAFLLLVRAATTTTAAKALDPGNGRPDGHQLDLVAGPVCVRVCDRRGERGMRSMREERPPFFSSSWLWPTTLTRGGRPRPPGWPPVRPPRGRLRCPGGPPRRRRPRPGPPGTV